MARTDIRIGRDGIHSLAYGLDNLPFPGYFLVIYKADPNQEDDCILLDMDTRPHMASQRVNRHSIVAELKKYPEVPTRDIELIACDLPVGN